MKDNYAIAKDNYKKKIFILYLEFSNIPVILMGETGSEKTELIKQLMKMLNKGKTDCLIIRNMHSGIKENEIIENINKAEKKLEESRKKNKLLILKLNNFLRHKLNIIKMINNIKKKLIK